MTVDGMAFLDQLVRAKRDCHVNPAELPLHPGAPVEPYVALLHPFLSLELPDGLKHGFGTNPVRSVRIRKISCEIYLMRSDFLEKVDDDIHILLCTDTFLDASCLVERKVEEVGVGVLVESERTDCSSCLGSADGCLDVEKRSRLRLSRLLGSDYGLHFVELVGKSQLMSRIHMLKHYIVMHSHIPGSLVCHMHIMSVLHQAYEGTAHRDDVIIRMRREYHHPLRERG